MIPLDVAATRLLLALAGEGYPVAIRASNLAVLATWARDRGPETVAAWVIVDPGCEIMPSCNRNQNPFGRSLFATPKRRPLNWRAYLHDAPGG